MKEPQPKQVEYAREAGGIDCELTVTCKKPETAPPEKTRKPQPPSSPRTSCELTPEQTYICDHATD